MTVAHITYHYLPVVGGQEVYIKNLIDVLESDGISNIVYQPISKSYNYFTHNKASRVKLVFNLPLLGRLIPNIGKYLFNLFLLLHYFAFLKYDKILVHYAFHSLPFWFFKKKVIVISHGVEWYVDRKTLNDKISHLIASITFNRFKIVANDTHYYRTFNLDISPNEKYFEEIEPNKWFIPNCVDQNNFKPTEPLKEFKDRNIIFVPRQITWDRGIHLAIESFNLFHKNINNFQLLIAGTIKDSNYKTYCDEIIEKNKLSSKVIWNHNIHNENINQYYSSSKITLIPTVRREGTSLSALESMACGCPVVSTNVAGLADLPTLQADPNAEELSKKMCELLDNYDEIKEYQKNTVRIIFNLQNWTKAWLNVIRD